MATLPKMRFTKDEVNFMVHVFERNIFMTDKAIGEFVQQDKVERAQAAQEVREQMTGPLVKLLQLQTAMMA